jgi:hypothetical protein
MWSNLEHAEPCECAAVNRARQLVASDRQNFSVLAAGLKHDLLQISEVIKCNSSKTQRSSGEKFLNFHF